MSVFNMLPLNGVAVIKIDGEMCTLNVYDNHQELKRNSKRKLGNLKIVLEELKGKRNCIVNSDIYDVTNEKIKIKNLEKHTLKRILVKVMDDCVGFLSKISKEENLDLILHISIEENNPALTIIAGLEGDVQVLLFDIHYERNERSITC